MHCDTQPGKHKGRRWKWLGRSIWAVGGLAVLFALIVLFWLRGALYHRLVRFPREQAAWSALRAQREPVPADPEWKEYRGILHTHSELSHDCEVPFEQILRVLQTNRLDFICLSDHCTDGRADFSLQWRGIHEGKLFVPGFEMRSGLMPFGVAPGIVLSNQTEPAVLAKQVIEHGGVLFYAHPEEPRDWNCPELTGMEIYNVHTDAKRLKNGLTSLLPDILVNLNRFPDHVVRLIFHRPTDLLQRWDELNRTRHITGIAANDCHQNTGFRIICTGPDSLRLEDTSPETLKEFKLNWFTRPLARLLLGRREPGKTMFRLQLDPYERMSRYVNTHVLAHELAEDSLLSSLRAGRVFIGFDMLADSQGFLWCATNSSSRAVMGEATSFTPETQLCAASPLPCRFTILKDGITIHSGEGRALNWRPGGPGKYRVEAELKILGQWVPWVYANPIQLK